MKKKAKERKEEKRKGRKVIVKIFVSRSKVGVVTPLQKKEESPPLFSSSAKSAKDCNTPLQVRPKKG